MLVEKIKSIFADLRADHTVIVVTHKKDVMQIADQIVLVNHGQIVGRGTHDELMQTNQYYCDLQLSGDSSSPIRPSGRTQLVTMPSEDG